MLKSISPLLPKKSDSNGAVSAGCLFAGARLDLNGIDDFDFDAGAGEAFFIAAGFAGAADLAGCFAAGFDAADPDGT